MLWHLNSPNCKQLLCYINGPQQARDFRRRVLRNVRFQDPVDFCYLSGGRNAHFRFYLVAQQHVESYHLFAGGVGNQKLQYQLAQKRFSPNYASNNMGLWPPHVGEAFRIGHISWVPCLGLVKAIYVDLDEACGTAFATYRKFRK